MARAALIFGILLILLGLVGYTTTGRTSPTALIPAGFGLLILVCGLVGVGRCGVLVNQIP